MSDYEAWGIDGAWGVPDSEPDDSPSGLCEAAKEFEKKVRKLETKAEAEEASRHQYASGGPVRVPSWLNEHHNSLLADINAEPDLTPQSFWDIASEDDQAVHEFLIALHEETADVGMWIKKPDFISIWTEKKKNGLQHSIKDLDKFIEVLVYKDADGQEWVQWND